METSFTVTIQGCFHAIFSGRFVPFVVQREFLRYQRYSKVTLLHPGSIALAELVPTGTTMDFVATKSGKTLLVFLIVRGS